MIFILSCWLCHIPLHFRPIAFYSIYTLNPHHLSASNGGHQSMFCIDHRGETKCRSFKEKVRKIPCNPCQAIQINTWKMYFEHAAKRVQKSGVKTKSVIFMLSKSLAAKTCCRVKLEASFGRLSRCSQRCCLQCENMLGFFWTHFVLLGAMEQPIANPPWNKRPGRESNSNTESQNTTCSEFRTVNLKDVRDSALNSLTDEL